MIFQILGLELEPFPVTGRLRHGKKSNVAYLNCKYMAFPLSSVRLSAAGLHGFEDATEVRTIAARRAELPVTYGQRRLCRGKQPTIDAIAMYICGGRSTEQLI